MRRISGVMITIVALAAVGVPFQPLTFGDDAFAFEAAWNQRRTVAPYVRCRTETVRVIRANSLGEDFNFPAKEMIVDEDREFLVDTARRRIRSESNYFICVHGKSLQKRHAITLFTPERIVSYTLSMDGTAAAMSMPTIYETPDRTRGRTLDALFCFEPPMWALGFMTSADIDRRKMEKRDLEFFTDSKHGMVVSPKENPLLRYDVDRDMGFGFTRCVLYAPDSKTFEADTAGLSIDVTWQRVDQGWYPQNWQCNIGSEQRSTKVAAWEFLDHVPDDLWEEPKGVREPGRLIYTKDGARRLDNDLVIIPAGSYEKPRSWFNSVVVLALVGVVASVVYWRRKAHASAGDRVK